MTGLPARNQFSQTACLVRSTSSEGQVRSERRARMVWDGFCIRLASWFYFQEDFREIAPVPEDWLRRTSTVRQLMSKICAIPLRVWPLMSKSMTARSRSVSFPMGPQAERYFESWSFTALFFQCLPHSFQQQALHRFGEGIHGPFFGGAYCRWNAAVAGQENDRQQYAASY